MHSLEARDALSINRPGLSVSRFTPNVSVALSQEINRQSLRHLYPLHSYNASLPDNACFPNRSVTSMVSRTSSQPVCLRYESTNVGRDPWGAITVQILAAYNGLRAKRP